MTATFLQEMMKRKVDSKNSYPPVKKNYKRKVFAIEISIIDQAIPIKCFVSHRPPSPGGGSVGQKKKKNEHMIVY